MGTEYDDKFKCLQNIYIDTNYYNGGKENE